MAEDLRDSDTDHEARAQLQDAAEVTAVISAVTTTDAASNSSSQTKGFTISIPPEAAAQDDELITYLTTLVNTIYFDSESSFWTPGFKRTNASEIKSYLSTNSLALAWRTGSSPSSFPSTNLPSSVLGCVNIKLFPHEEPPTAEFGMLACDPSARGTGVGSGLLRFAEDEARRRGARRMRLELLQGDGWRHEFKDRLERWYARNGYRLVRVEDVRKNWDFLVPLLARPTVMKVFAKEL